MKRFSLILALCGLVGVTLAQAPKDDGLPEELGGPPIRLKKKGQDPNLDKPKIGENPTLDPEEKPKEPKEENPVDPPIEPPKLEEDEKLDEMEDIQPQDEAAEILDRIAKNTRSSEERLANEELGEGTRQVQKDIIDDLDKLIDAAQNNQNNQNNQGGQGQQADQQNQGGQGGKSGQKQRPSSRLSRNKNEGRNGQGQGQDQKQLTRNDGKKPQEGAGAGNDPKGGNGGPQGDKPDPDKGLDLWGHLPERERMLMNRYMREKFMEKYERVTQEYYRRLAEKSR